MTTAIIGPAEVKKFLGFIKKYSADANLLFEFYGSSIHISAVDGEGEVADKCVLELL